MAEPLSTWLNTDIPEKQRQLLREDRDMLLSNDAAELLGQWSTEDPDRRYAAVCAAGAPAADMTVVFDAGQNFADNFAYLAGTGLHYVGSVPASGCPDLTALPATARGVVDQERFGGLTACDTRRVAYGAERRAILTHSPELHESQARGFDGATLAKAGKKLDELAATLARGKTRRPRGKVEAEIETITRKPWVRRVVTWQLAGEQPRDLRLSWGINEAARAALEEELFGKRTC